VFSFSNLKENILAFTSVGPSKIVVGGELSQRSVAG